MENRRRQDEPRSQTDRTGGQAGEYGYFPHDADLGVQGAGPTRAQAFAQAALALMNAMTDAAEVAPRTAVEIERTAPDDRLLLMDWLNALIFEMAVRRMLFSKFDITITGHTLRATAWGEAVDPERHPLALEPKGATFTGLRVARQPDGGWLAQCVVDV